MLKYTTVQSTNTILLKLFAVLNIMRFKIIYLSITFTDYKNMFNELLYPLLSLRERNALPIC
jgi:hypothetical protein